MGRAFERRKASKQARWDKMSKIFPKLGKAITVAAKEGGIDADMNPQLRTAIEAAKSQNMPKDLIDNAIKRASGKDSSDIKTVFYDGKAAHGVLIIVECATDNTTRSVANVKSIFSKNKGEFLPSGSLTFMFTRKAVFEVEDDGRDLEELELELIDFGLDNLERIEADENEPTSKPSIKIFAAYEDFGTLNEGIEKLKLKVLSGNLQYIANNPLELSEEQYSDIENLLDKLEDDDDVQAIYTNIE